MKIYRLFLYFAFAGCALTTGIIGQLNAMEQFDNLTDLDDIELPPAKAHTTIDLPQLIEGLKLLDPDEIRLLLLLLIKPHLNLLKGDFIAKTRQLRKRSILDLPTVQLFRSDLADWLFEINFLYSYGQENIANFFARAQAETILARVLPLFGSDAVREILKELDGVFVEQRYSGFVFNIAKNQGDWRFALQFPLYYLERNFNAPGDPDIPDDYIEAHLVSDRIGIGDTRLIAGYQLVDHPRARLEVGGELTIPTAFDFKTGLKGSGFPHVDYRPDLVLNAVIEDISQCNVDRALCRLINTGNAFVDQMAALMLNEKMGNNHHPSIGLFIHPEFIASDDLTVKSRIAIEYLIPKKERRYLLSKRDLSGFDERDFCDGEDLVDDVDFLNDQIFDALFFNNVDTTVHPGIIGKWLTAVYFTPNDNWQFQVGIDLWFQAAEELCRVKPCNPIRKGSICLATMPSAHQGRVFGGITYTRETADSLWQFSLNGDKTGWDNDIGKGFTVGFQATGYY